MSPYSSYTKPVSAEERIEKGDQSKKKVGERQRGIEQKESGEKTKEVKYTQMSWAILPRDRFAKGGGVAKAWGDLVQKMKVGGQFRLYKKETTKDPHKTSTGAKIARKAPTRKSKKDYQMEEKEAAKSRSQKEVKKRGRGIRGPEKTKGGFAYATTQQLMGTKRKERKNRKGKKKKKG